MAFISRSINIPIFMEVEVGAVTKIDGIIKENNFYFKRVFVLVDSGPIRRIGEEISECFVQTGAISNVGVVKSNTMESVNWIRSKIIEFEPDVIIGSGGGKVIDVGKYVASEEKIHFISVPTVPSHDGIASPVAVIKIGNKSHSLGTKMPIGIIVDLEVIRNAPERFIKAGVGDLISNLSACKDWRLACKKGKDKFDVFAELLAKIAADSVLNYKSNDIRNLKFLRRLVEGLILSGISMSIAGSSRPCSGAEHMISHSLDKILVKPALHGEQVAIGTLIADCLREDDISLLKDYFLTIGLPLSYLDLGIDKNTLIEAIIAASQTRPGRYTILDEIELKKGKLSEILDYISTI